MTAHLVHLGAALGAGALALALAPADAPAPVLTVSPATQAGSPWPTMRHDLRNTGASDLIGTDPGTAPWSFTTDVGIFSTPVVAADGTIYVGSADNVLHGLDRSGTEVWRFTTGGIIDTAPALLAAEPGIGDSLVLGSGDEILRRVRTDPDVPDSQRVVWELEALPPAAGSTQLVSWWEGSPNVGPDGTIYQGNTGGQSYAVTPEGRVRWATESANAVWTVPAVDEQGTTYWGSVDARMFALDSSGRQLWQRTTLGLRHLLCRDGHRRGALPGLVRRHPLRPRPQQRLGALDVPDRRSHLRLPRPHRGFRRRPRAGRHRLHRRAAALRGP